jgi:mRNA interferase RelE/StbE
VTQYLVTFAAAAKKELKDLPSDALARVFPRIRELAENPRPVGCKKLHGYKDRWRIRAGNYRVVFTIDDGRKSVDVTRIAHRKDAYE